MKRALVLVLLTGISCSSLHIRKVHGMRVKFMYFRNNTGEPELEKLLQEECIRTFKKAGVTLNGDDFKVGVEISAYRTSPHFYSGSGETTYRSVMEVKWEVSYRNGVKTFKLSEYEDYPRSGNILDDELNEEEAKRKLISTIVEEAYEYIVRLKDE